MELENRTADELEIRNVLARLLWEADTAEIDDLDTYLSCFTEDAQWEMFSDVRRGHDDLRAGAEERRRSAMMGPGTTVVHFLSCTEVSFEDDDNARVRSYIQAYRNAPKDPQLFIMGQYHDTFRRTVAGWKLANRVVTF